MSIEMVPLSATDGIGKFVILFVAFALMGGLIFEE